MYGIEKIIADEFREHIYKVVDDGGNKLLVIDANDMAVIIPNVIHKLKETNAFAIVMSVPEPKPNIIIKELHGLSESDHLYQGFMDGVRWLLKWQKNNVRE